MTTRFLLTDYAHSWVADSLFVWCATDVPCHMFLRWTEVEMLVHLREKRIRGLNVEGNPKYCFVEWIEVEQNEAGDTLTHTFNFPSWGPGDCRWWHFRAEIASVESPSNTGIITACFEEQENALSLKHTDLVDKEPGGVIDHADATITPDKMVAPFVWNDTPFTPSAAPTEDFEVANKKYVDDSAGGVSRYSLRRVGRLYAPTGSSLKTILTLGANRLYALPFIIAAAQAIDQIGIEVLTLSAGNTRLTIYQDNGAFYPGALWLNAGLVSTGSTGVKVITISTTLAPGLWWLCVNSPSTPTLRSVTPTMDAVNGFLTTPFQPVLGPNANGVPPAPPPPDPFPALHGVFENGPLVFFRAA